MKPFEIEWQNTRAWNKPWVSFDPKLKIIAPDDVAALRLVHERRLVPPADPIRAVEISWEDYLR